MAEQTRIEALGERRYLIRASLDDDKVEILVYATPSVIERLTDDPADEIRVIEATGAFLLARQRPDDLPSQLDLDEVVAAYEDFEGDVRRYLAQPGPSEPS